MVECAHFVVLQELQPVQHRLRALEGEGLRQPFKQGLQTGMLLEPPLVLNLPLGLPMEPGPQEVDRVPQLGLSLSVGLQV